MKYTNEFKYYYWGPCLTRFILSDELCYGLLQRGNTLKEDARKGLAGHLNKELKYTQEDQDWFLSKFSPVINDHMNFLNTYHNKNIEVNIKLTDLWINYMKKGEFNPLHHHTGKFSFVIFMKIPTEFEDQKNLPHKQDNLN